jgi:hypothetical protein
MMKDDPEDQPLTDSEIEAAQGGGAAQPDGSAFLVRGEEGNEPAIGLLADKG